jgi:O-antigen/teichoic acid export membrane protein
MAMLVNQPGGYAEMGIYNAALVFQGIIVFLGAAINAPLLSMVAHEKVSLESRLSKVNILLTWGLGVFVALPLLCFPELAQMLYGQKFSDASFTHTFVIIVFITCTLVYKQGLARVLIASNLLWWSFLSNLIWGSLVLFSAFFLVKWGAVGVAAAYAIAYMLVTIFFIPLYLKLGLVPRKTIISFEATVIWLVVIYLALMSWINVPVIYRTICFLITIILTITSFWRLLKLP